MYVFQFIKFQFVEGSFEINYNSICLISFRGYSLYISRLNRLNRVLYSCIQWLEVLYYRSGVIKFFVYVQLKQQVPLM